MSWTADALFGIDPTAQQPSATAEPEHLGRPEPVARTLPNRPVGGAESPALAMVVLIALAVGIAHLVSKG